MYFGDLTCAIDKELRDRGERSIFQRDDSDRSPCRWQLNWQALERRVLDRERQYRLVNHGEKAP